MIKKIKYYVKGND